jgi:hypothetical protein
MAMLRIKQVVPLAGYRLRLTLTDDTILERDVSSLLVGPVFEAIRRDPGLFSQVRVERGTVVWPGGVDLCPDVLIWNGPPPESSSSNSPVSSSSETNSADPPPCPPAVSQKGRSKKQP